MVPTILIALFSIGKLGPRKAVKITIISVLFLAVLFRFYQFYTLGDIPQDVWDKFFSMQVCSRLDGIMFGVLGAYIYHYYPEFWNRNRSIFFYLGIALFGLYRILEGIVYYNSFYRSVFSFTVVALAFLLIIPFMHHIKSGSGRLYRSITRISIISYSMYLLNLNVIFLIVMPSIHWWEFGLNDPFVKFLIFWVFTIFTSSLLYKYFEAPMMALRDKN